jgi:hypothetical protein
LFHQYGSIVEDCWPIKSYSGDLGCKSHKNSV